MSLEDKYKTVKLLAQIHIYFFGAVLFMHLIKINITNFTIRTQETDQHNSIPLFRRLLPKPNATTLYESGTNFPFIRI
jgi:hypothetical protein